MSVVTIGPGCDIEDPFGYWATAREVEDDGCILVRPDQHVAWRSTSAAADPVAALRKVMTSILGV
jgi:2,4-dichlorophenol 6-monooxygenase